MLTVLALSAVVQKPIQTRFPVCTPSTRNDGTASLTKFDSGRDVATVIPVNILWTVSREHQVTDDGIVPINHFVPLMPIPVPADEGVQVQVRLEATPTVTVTTDYDADVSCVAATPDPRCGER